MRKYGLIGYPLSHSFSPSYFAAKFESNDIVDASYHSFPIEKVDEIKDLISNGVVGFNVTSPYKQQIIPLLDEVSEEAKAVGAVNTVKIVDGKLIGYNTDIYGLENSLYTLLDGSCVENALILGTGGAAKACQYVLDKMGIQPTLVSRGGQYLHYDELNKSIIEKHRLIINSTPLGMSKLVDFYPNIPYKYLNDLHFVYDLIYNPKKTLFLTQAEDQGATILNGLSMLHDQADKSWEIWNTDL